MAATGATGSDSFDGSDGPAGSGGWPGVDERLARDRARTIEQITTLARLVGEIVAAARDVATDDEHDPEGQTIAFERAQAAALLRQARARLDDIEAARARLAAGGYGVCERCGQPIATARLDARPIARTCIACARS
jgi:RNA polymerase-binding transcription factor